MNITTILVTRSNACHVKTLHTILKMNVYFLENSIKNKILFVNDNIYEKIELIQSVLKTSDRVIFIDFGVGVDTESIKEFGKKHDNVGCLVFPGVKSGIDWDLFKIKVNNESDEPVSQMGLHFDTDIGKKVSTDLYNVVNTEAKCWFLNTKNVIKSIRDKKTGNCKIYPNMFSKFKEQGVRIFAFTAAKLTITYPHECISNILNAAGVKVN